MAKQRVLPTVENTMTPLTPEEAEFAGDHYLLIYRVMHDCDISGSDCDDCFDYAVFYYFKSVKAWINRPELHKWAFSSVAYKDIKDGVKYYLRCRNQNYKDALSFDAESPKAEDDDCTLYNMVYGNKEFDYLFEDEAEHNARKAKQALAKQIEKHLTDKQFDIVTMRSNGLSWGEIADLLGVCESYVRQAVADSRKSVAKMLKKKKELKQKMALYGAAKPYLTEREAQILYLISTGLTHRETAARLNISVGSVATTTDRIRKKIVAAKIPA